MRSLLKRSVSVFLIHGGYSPVISSWCLVRLKLLLLQSFSSPLFHMVSINKNCTNISQIATVPSLTWSCLVTITNVGHLSQVYDHSSLDL